MNWVLHLNEGARKNLIRLPQNDRARINDVLLEMSKETPYLGDIVKLDNEDNLWRRRIGAYRVKFQVRDKDRIIYVYGIERRTSKTY